MISELRALYEKSPGWLQQCVCLIPFNYRLGARYRRTLRFLRESDNWTAAQYREYQRTQLGLLLEQAIRNVPYYSRYRKLLGRDPFDILSDIEPISKREMQDDLERFVMPPGMRGKSHVTHTGGSSGVPLTIQLDNEALGTEWAFMITQWSRVGYRPGDRRVTFRGVDFDPKQATSMRRNPVYNELLCSPFQLTEDCLSEYVAEIKRFRPKFLRGYPSALTVLAQYVEERRITDLPRLAALLCGSESFAAGQRKYLERVFGARVFSWYGMTEKVVLAGECEKSTQYHCFPQYGITEVADAAGNLTSRTGSSGEIVGTGFLNRVMPFIRYRLDDRAEIAGDHCPECGRAHLVLANVRGHYPQAVIVGKSGALISLTALNLHDDSFQNVRQFQFHQKRRGEVNLYLRVDPGFDSERRRLILKTLTRKTGADLDYRIELVDRIEPSPLGKGVYLRQELPDTGEFVASHKEKDNEQTKLD